MTEEVHTKSLGEIQGELAHTRTLLAMDRTLLAWVRTSLSLNAFGFTLAKFVHDLMAAGTLKGVAARYPRDVGIVLMVLGITSLLAGALDYFRSVQRLKNAVTISPWSASLVVALILAALSIFLMASLFAETS